jgi:UDP-N-acetylglucosamine 4,6-dehydratase
LLKGKTILITGGSGSFGSAFAEYILKNDPPKKLIIFSRDWLKHDNLKDKLKSLEQETYLGNTDKVRYLIGDIRYRERLERAFKGVDIVVHAAALKEITSCEFNPAECMLTNIVGTQNVVDAAIDCGVEKVILISTDKAVAPINTYGKSKAFAESLILQGNNYSPNKTKFSVCRYGNVIGSNGSVIPLFKKLIAESATELPLTDPLMTRFFFKMENAVKFVLESLEKMKGEEIFIPKIPSARIVDLIEAFEMPYKVIGIRKNEKLHEVLDEGYDSCSNEEFLTIEQLKEIINEF